MGDKFELVTMSDTALMSVTHAAVEVEPEEDVEGEEGEEGTDSSDSPDGDQSSDSGNEEGSDS